MSNCAPQSREATRVANKWKNNPRSWVYLENKHSSHQGIELNKKKNLNSRSQT